MSDTTSARNVIPLSARGSAAMASNEAKRAAMRLAYGTTPPGLLSVADDLAVPASIPAGSSWTSPVIPSYGQPHVAVGFTLSQNGGVTLNRFLDFYGAVAAGTAAATATANNVC